MTGADPELVSEERSEECQFNVLDGEEIDERVETQEEWVRIHRRPRQHLLSFPRNSEENGGSLTNGERERDASRSAAEVNRKHRVQEILGVAQQPDETTSGERPLARCER